MGKPQGKRSGRRRWRQCLPFGYSRGAEIAILLPGNGDFILYINVRLPPQVLKSTAINIVLPSSINSNFCTSKPHPVGGCETNTNFEGGGARNNRVLRIVAAYRDPQSPTRRGQPGILQSFKTSMEACQGDVGYIEVEFPEQVAWGSATSGASQDTGGCATCLALAGSAYFHKGTPTRRRLAGKPPWHTEFLGPQPRRLSQRSLAVSDGCQDTSCCRPCENDAHKVRGDANGDCKLSRRWQCDPRNDHSAKHYTGANNNGAILTDPLETAVS